MSFVLDPAGWLPSESGPEEFRATATPLGITVCGLLATSIIDDWSRSSSDRVRIAAYPLAEWLASSWWRLRWEPMPISGPTVDWRMGHEMTAVGQGFIWPHLRFDSDGERVEVTCGRSPGGPSEPIRYVQSFRTSLPATEFVRGVDDFIEIVLARLANLGSASTSLHDLWSAVREERADPEKHEFRRIEAQLGFDPDDAPSALVERLLKLRQEMGAGAVRELSAIKPARTEAALRDQLQKIKQAAVIEGRFELPRFREPSAAAPPWERGRQLARELRDHLAVGDGRVSSGRLAELLSITESKLNEPGTEAPVAGIAIRGKGDTLRLGFRRKLKSGRRFEAARWIGAGLVAPPSEHWIASTDSSTAQQKFQRAFATELLAPIEVLRARLAPTYGEDAIEELAQELEVSPLAILSNLANHQLISRESVAVAF